MSKKVKLKPCPFCGEQPSILKNMGTVFCGNDACFGPQTTAERLEDSAVQWNARASSPAQEPVTTEPVAWRWKVHGIWHYAGGFPVSGAEPLYAIPAPPQPGREDSELEELVAQAIWEECCPGMKWGQIDHLIYCRMAGAAIARMRALIGEPK